MNISDINMNWIDLEIEPICDDDITEDLTKKEAKKILETLISNLRKSITFVSNNLDVSKMDLINYFRYILCDLDFDEKLQKCPMEFNAKCREFISDDSKYSKHIHSCNHCLNFENCLKQHRFGNYFQELESIVENFRLSYEKYNFLVRKAIGL